MEHWVLHVPPLVMGNGDGWVLWQNASQVPPEQVGVVHQRLGVVRIVVEENWSVAEETSTITSDNKVHHPEVTQSYTGVKTLDRKFTDEEDTQKTSQVSASSSGCVVVIGPVNGTGDFLHFAFWHP